MTLEDLWWSAATDLGLILEIPKVVRVRALGDVRARILVRHFGARGGMLVFTDSGIAMEAGDALWAQGYGLSVLSEPSPGRKYQRNDYIELLSDWGWTGESAARPAWLI